MSRTHAARSWIAAASLLVSGSTIARAHGHDSVAPLAPPEVLMRDDRGGVTVRAIRVPEPIVLDGRLLDPYYADTASIDGFVQQEPLEGEPASERTEAWIFFDDDRLYVSARLWDTEPERIVANEMRRDHPNISRGASFTVVLDTFFDRRNGFYFETNPLGAIRDGVITNESDLNTDWNTVWSAKASRFEFGWTVEISIPFRSLRYREASSSTMWGIQLKRQVTWKNEDSFLTRVPAAWQWRGVRKLSSAATLVGLETSPPARSVEMKPYAIAGIATDRTASPVPETGGSANVGFDAKYGVTKSLTADLTVNTDFAQVEADEQQVNLSRFSLFFPEKREFFLEGQGIFAFGGETGSGFQWGSNSYTPIMFFSRRIGMDEGHPTPIRAGGRLTGRTGSYTIGLMNIQTGDKPDSRPTNVTAARLSRDLFARGNVGVLFTNRSVSPGGEGASQLVGADANFAFFQNLRINTYYAESKTGGREGDERSYLAKVSNLGDRYGFEYEHLLVGGDFKPEVGFVRRDDFRRNFARAYFSPRPRSLDAVRKLRVGASMDWFHGVDRGLQTRQLSGEAAVELERGDQAGLDVRRSQERLDHPFEIVDGVVIPVGTYEFDRLGVSYQLGTQRRVSGSVSVEAGGFYGGSRTEAGYWGRVELTPQLSVEPSISLNWVDLPQGRFTTQLLRARVSFTLSPRMFVSGLLQYNSEGGSLGLNARLRWEFEPGSDLFVVYTDGRDTRLGGFPSLVQRGLVVKLTKLMRF